ncbi:MAG: hypothetical protein J5I93_13655 [Pirellulaceae bacterium]|nr:hypothetical protein [Pirellulaceae bacterium]
MVNVFAREITDNLASLVKKLDAVVGENQDKQMRGFVVLLSEDPDADEAKLKELAKKHGIKNVPLTIFDGVAGPGSYKISKDADVTVHYWLGTEVKSNHAFAKGQLSEAAIEKVVADAPKILN